MMNDDPLIIMYNLLYEDTGAGKNYVVQNPPKKLHSVLCKRASMHNTEPLMSAISSFTHIRIDRRLIEK